MRLSAGVTFSAIELCTFPFVVAIPPLIAMLDRASLRATTCDDCSGDRRSAMTARDNRVTRRTTPGRLTPGSGDPHDVREVRGMLRIIEQLGYDFDALLAATGLERADVENPDAYISPRACAAVFARANQERRVPPQAGTLRTSREHGSRS
jgi:hypothetical protein